MYQEHAQILAKTDRIFELGVVKAPYHQLEVILEYKKDKGKEWLSVNNWGKNSYYL